MPPPAGAPLTSGCSWRRARTGSSSAYIHGDRPRQLLIALTDALVIAGKQPTLDELYRLFQLLNAEAAGIRGNYGTLFGARAFKDLVFVAVDFATRGKAPAVHVPRADHLRPNRDFLAERYALFRRAS